MSKGQVPFATVGAIIAVALASPSAFVHRAVMTAAFAHNEGERPTATDAKAAPTSEHAANSDVMEMTGDLLPTLRTRDIDKHVLLASASAGLEINPGELPPTDPFSTVGKDLDHEVVDRDAFERAPLVDQADLQPPYRPGLIEALPIGSLRNRLEAAARSNPELSTGNHGGVTPISLDEAGSFANRAQHVRRADREERLRSAIVMLKTMIQVLGVVVTGFLTLLFLMFRDWMPDRHRRRMGMRAACAAGAFLLLVTTGTVIFAAAALTC